MDKYYILTPEKEEEIKARKLKIPNQESISDVFEKILDDKSDGCSLVTTCEFCGRTYFGDSGDFEEGEHEYLKKCAELNPKMFIEGGDYWATTYINGHNFVLGCSCNGPRRAETFMWEHRKLFVKFLRAKIADIQQKATEEQNLINEIPSVGEQIAEFDIEA